MLNQLKTDVNTLLIIAVLCQITRDKPSSTGAVKGHVVSCLGVKPRQ